MSDFFNEFCKKVNACEARMDEIDFCSFIKKVDAAKSWEDIPEEDWVSAWGFVVDSDDNYNTFEDVCENNNLKDIIESKDYDEWFSWIFGITQKTEDFWDQAYIDECNQMNIIAAEDVRDFLNTVDKVRGEWSQIPKDKWKQACDALGLPYTEGQDPIKIYDKLEYALDSNF